MWAWVLWGCGAGAVIEEVSPQPLSEEPEVDDIPVSIVDTCFAEITGADDAVPDYDSIGPEVGSHCSGTDHQDIEGIERVVFLGDSVTVGTPPTLDPEFFRNRLALELSARFDLEPPSRLWQGVSWVTGSTWVQDSGAFSSCARWGAVTADLDQQLEDCFPAARRDEKTLVVMTIGGNDLADLMFGFTDGMSEAELWDLTLNFLAELDQALAWLTDEQRFPNGVFVVNSNLIEFTDGTGDPTSCTLAVVSGMTANITDPALEAMVLYAMEDYLRMATTHGTDLVFLLEHFCGHGFNRDDTEGRCYRGPDAELWFDSTCIHPNPTGHGVVAELFADVIRE